MFTKCPECQTAFRVTAQVLQQANGRVRCGGCGSAFSAIDHLSEDMPTPQDAAAPPPQQDIQDDLPTDDELAQTSKQLLKTLEELAGPEQVRIEDTGVEWRVMDDDDGENAAGAEPADTGSVRWYLEEGESNLPEISDEVTEEDRAGSTNVDEMRFDDNTQLPDDFGADDEEESPPPSPLRRETDVAAQEAALFDENQVDLALGEPEEWGDLLDEVGDEKQQGDEIPLEVEEELAAIHNELSSKPAPSDNAEAAEPEAQIPSDIDTQFDIQAEAMGLDITGNREVVAGEEVPAEAEDEIVEETDADGEIAASVDEPEHEAADAMAPDDEDVTASDKSDETPAVGIDSTDEFRAQIDVAAVALANEEFDVYEAPEREMTAEDLEVESDEPPDYYQQGRTDPDEELDAPMTQASPYAETAAGRHEVEEEDDKPIQPEVAAGDEADVGRSESEDRLAATMAGIADPSELFDENSGEVETIIMEGDFVRGSLEKERLATERKAAANLRQGKSLADTYALNRGMVKGGRRRTDPASTAVIAVAIILVLLLIGQFVHASRESFATNALFNNTIAPIYRLLGKPITPEWDIKGWQFESTSGSTDDAEQVLTISSRITNRSDQPLPYPLVHVSLADRFEEIIGSRVLEPNEYLAGDLDPRRPVAPGDNFTAVITIGDLSPDATGFKLNVCYRVSAGQMRCATEDFKN